MMEEVDVEYHSIVRGKLFFKQFRHMLVLKHHISRNYLSERISPYLYAGPISRSQTAARGRLRKQTKCTSERRVYQNQIKTPKQSSDRKMMG